MAKATVQPSGPLDPYAGAPLAENPFIMQAVTPGAPILPSSYEQAYDQRNAAPTTPAPHPVPASDKGPAPDPYAGAPVIAEDPYAGAPAVTDVRGYDMAKLAATPLDKLLKDKAEFNPVEFYAKNTDALLADPKALEKVEAVFDARDKERMTAGQLAKKIATAPLTIPYNIVAHPIESAKTGAKIVKGGVEFVGDLLGAGAQIVKTGAESAGHLSAGDLKGASKGISEGVGAVDTATQKWVTLITDKVGPSLGVIPRGQTPRERLAYDAEFKKAELRAAEGNGELAKTLGTSQDELKASGITLDPNAIEKMAPLTDPFFLVPVGGAIGVVGRGGKFLLGRATSPALAEAFAKGVNAAMEKAAAWPIAKAGEGLAKAGEVIETRGPAAIPRAAKGYSAIHAAMTGDITPLAASLVAPKAVELGGKALGAVGRGLEAIAPAAGHVISEGIKGTAEGAALSLPFYLGSTPEEREGLPGMALGAGFIRGGLAAGGIAGHAAERRIQEARAAKVFEAADRGPVRESPYYGTDGALDEAHAAKEATMTPRERSVLSWARETFRDAGIEVYALDKDTFKNHVPNVAGAEAAPGFFLKRGERIGPEGSRQPVMQILLNTDTSALGHELYHAFKSLDPQGAQALESHISKTWTPEEQDWIANTYNAALNGGKPESQWVQRYDKQQILEEAAAEVFGRVLHSTDLSGVQPGIIKRAVDFTSRALEKVGNPIAGKGLGQGPGVSELGVRPSHAEVDISRDFLADITRRVKDGSLGPAKGPAGPAPKRPGGPRTSREAVQPLTPEDVAPAAPAPKPATPPPAPEAPVAAPPVLPEHPPTPKASGQPAPEAPNIRVTPQEQQDFAAERAKVTNADQALKAAEKSGDPQQVQHVEAINASMDAGHAVEIVHKGVIREGGPTPEAPVKRGTRRAEQEEAYVAEAMGAVPEDIRELHQKTFFATRWLKAGKQLTARSLDKVLANIKNAVDMSHGKVALPYEVDAAGKLTHAGWSEVVQDLKDYWTNQDRGFRGDGERLAPETRTRDIGQSIPPEDPRGPSAMISPERTDFLNLVQGLNIPKAVTRQTKGVVPGNIKGQLLAEAQGKRPAAPSVIDLEDVGRQQYKPIEGIGVRSIAEVNPLRNDLRAAGAPVENLIEVTENINRENIVSVTPRPDMPGRGGSTDITRGGFSVSASPEVRAELDKILSGEKFGETFTLDGSEGVFSVKNVDEAAKLLDKTPEEWTATTQSFKGGLTQEAYRLGLSLTDRADLGRLAELSKKAQDQFKSTMAEGDMDGAMAQATKAQFYREAWEAAQGIKSAKEGIKRFAKDEGIGEAKPPFPVAEGDSFSPATAKGKELEKEGYDFRVTGELGNRTVNVFKDGLPIGYASSRQMDPRTAELAMVNIQKAARGKGLGEAIYRELLNQLQKDGVELVEGMAVAPEPIALRNKIFGGRFEKMEAGGEPISLNDALTGANLLKKGVSSVPFPGIDVINRIRPEDKFSVKSVPTDKEVTAALSEDKKPFVGAHRDLEPGTPVGLRIDIPAFTRHGTYVVTVHEKAKGGTVGKRIGYDSVATVDNPVFFSNEKGALKIKEGAAKFPIATVEGEYNPSRSIPQNLKGWTEVGYNPTKHSYFYDKATDEPVVSGSQAVSAGNSVFVKDAKFGNKEDYAFSVKGQGIAPEDVKPAKEKKVKAPKVEKEPKVTPETAEATVEKINREMDVLFPEAKPLRYVRESDGSLKIENGKLVPADEEARLQETPLAKEALKANPDKAPDEAISDALSDKIVSEAQEVLKNPDVAKGLTWYDDAVKLIKKYYGEHADKFAQLLAATSPRNGVQVNFAYAVEAFNNFMKGKYDRNVEEYLKIRDEWAKGEGENLEQWKKEKGKKWKEGNSNLAVSLRNNFLSWAVDKHKLLPLREGVMKKGELTGTLYGMHTFAVLDVLANTWLQDVEGPKVRNFLANLTGTGHEATIDIWATRFLMRLSQDAESLKGKWRVSPPAGEGISDENFALAQKAFRKAADKMGVTPDALQALVWFSEKHMWEENNWTGFSGAAKSDYAYWLRGLEPGETPGTHEIPQKLKEEATLQGQQERARAEERRQARNKLLSGAGLNPVVESQ